MRVRVLEMTAKGCMVFQKAEMEEAMFYLKENPGEVNAEGHRVNSRNLRSTG